MRESKTAMLRIADFIRKKPVIILVLVITLIFGGFYTTLMSIGTALVGQVQGLATTSTSFTAEDADILGANEDYKAMENELRMKLNNPEGYYPGYVNYLTGAASIGHDPYKLIALLTVLHERFTRAEVFGMIIPVAVVELTDVEYLSDRELVELAQENGVDLRKYIVCKI